VEKTGFQVAVLVRVEELRLSRDATLADGSELIIVARLIKRNAVCLGN
jgi:hypothetical protein